MTKLECLQAAAKSQQKLVRLENRLAEKVRRVRAKEAGAIDAARTEVEMWMAKAAEKDPDPDTINAAPEWRTAEEIAAGTPAEESAK